MRIGFERYFLLFVLLQLFIVQRLQAVEYPPLIYLGIENGLSNNSVRCIFQDHNGFLWFGTYDGLNRFDGYEFKVFRNKLDDSTSLPHNFIYAIHEDRNNDLWIGTGQGACIYNNLTAKFQPVYYLNQANNRKEKLTVNVNAIVSDADGNIFIGTNGMGLMVQRPGAKAAVQIPIINEQGNQTTGYNAASVKIDKKQRIWLLIADIGLCSFDKLHKKLSVVKPFTGEACIEADNNDNIWIGTQRGLFRFNIPSQTMAPVGGNANEILSSGFISCLMLDKQDQLWIGTRGGGVNILNVKTGKVKSLLPEKTKNELSGESISAIFQDREGRIWIGAINGGLNIINPTQPKFRTITHDPLNQNSLVRNPASAFYEDKSGNLWIGTDGGGFSIWDRIQNQFTNFRCQPENKNSLSNNWVTSIKEDYHGNTWIATFGGGINRFDKNSGTFKHYSCFNPALNWENKNVWQLYEDKDKVLWASTFSNGKLYKYNTHEDRFDVFDQSLNDLYILAEDRSGELWAGNSHQLINIDKQHKKHIYYEMGKPVRAIYEDAKGNFWIGSEGGGLILFNRQKGKIDRRFSTSDGLCNNSVLCILEDNSHNLWLSTFNGLSRFSPGDKKFKNFYQEDGLQSNQFLFRAALRLKSGEMVFGGIKGFNIFDPRSIRPVHSMPPVLITGLRIKGEPIASGDKYITETAGDHVRTLTIPFNDAVLSVDFAALEYSAPGAVNYAYYLKGWDQGWNYSGKIRTANYTNLREGHYFLHIKSTNAEGVWGNNEQVLEVIVLPPWWRSWWAYSLYLIVIIALIYRYNLYQRDQERLKYQVQLADAKVAHEKELNEKKLSFFTQISHEFRTPLTLIINPIKEFLNSKNSQVETKELIVVYRNAQRLLSLVDQLLHFRKSDANKLNVTRFNVAVFCKEVYLCFIQQARSKGLNLEFASSSGDIELWADKEKVEIALFNLISNAFKFTPAGGVVQILLEESDNRIQIMVKDTGSGIDEEVGDRIFDNFFQVIDKESSGKTGFGIGLHLVKQVAESHGGSVSYTSKKGRGTTFKLELLKGKEHFDPKVIHEEQGELPVFIEELAGSQEPENIPDATPVTEPSLEIVTEKSTLLVVDDNDEIRNYIRQIFQASYTVYEAGSGEQALELINKELPDIIITDVIMGDMSGVELCEKIKEDPALTHIPVILLTSSSSAEIKLKGIEGGADDFITKPFDKDILIARVVNLLKSRNNLQKHFFNQITLKTDDFKVSPDFKEFLEKCIDITESHVDNPDFNVKILADELGMSHSALYKKVKLISGRSVNEFIRFIRLRKAAQLFINTDCNISEGAYQCGFSDVKYFREQFSKVFGMKPSEYIKIYRKSAKKPYRVNQTLGKTR